MHCGRIALVTLAVIVRVPGAVSNKALMKGTKMGCGYVTSTLNT